MTPTEELKQQIRRRIFARDCAEGAAAQSRFAAYFATCPTCRGSGIEQCWVRYGSDDICERSWCDTCDGTGFVEVVQAVKQSTSP